MNFSYKVKWIFFVSNLPPLFDLRLKFLFKGNPNSNTISKLDLNLIASCFLVFVLLQPAPDLSTWKTWVQARVQNGTWAWALVFCFSLCFFFPRNCQATFDTNSSSVVHEKHKLQFGSYFGLELELKISLFFKNVNIIKLFSPPRVVQGYKKNPNSSSSPKWNASLSSSFMVFLFFCFLQVLLSYPQCQK